MIESACSDTTLMVQLDERAFSWIATMLKLARKWPQLLREPAVPDYMVMYDVTALVKNKGDNEVATF